MKRFKVVALFFDAVPDKIVPELIAWRSEKNIDFVRLRPNIEKITNKDNVSDVLWDQMS